VRDLAAPGDLRQGCATVADHEAVGGGGAGEKAGEGADRDAVLRGVAAAVGCLPALIQAQAADSAPAGLRQQALWSFGLAYFAGLYGFPLIADVVIAAGGYQAFIAVLLGAAVLELAVSVRTRHAPAPANATGRPDVDWRRSRSYRR
jgi:hypothetical protein